MADIIILIAVAVIIVLALKGTVKHFKGEGACCGGGSKGLIKETRKTLEHEKIGEKTIQIEGMHCDHCRQSVTRALNRIDGVAANVDLKKKQAVVSLDRPIDEKRLKEAVEAEGFQVVSLRDSGYIG